jgi:hypothetical protein
MSAGIGSDSNRNIPGGCHESSGIAYYVYFYFVIFILASALVITD